MAYDQAGVQRTYSPYGPDLDTQWGTVPTPYLAYNPIQYRHRMPAVPQQIRGGFYEPVVNAVGLGQTETAMPTWLKYALLLGAGLLVGYMFFKGSKGGASANGRRRRRTVTKSGRRRMRQAGLSRALVAPRNAKGQFASR